MNSYISDTSRIGLLEIGSRAVRFLVADFETSGTFKPVKIETVRHGINPSQIDETNVDTINLIIETFSKKLTNYDCDRKLIYGTEICRLINKKFPKKLAAGLKVLTPSEEGKASWAAALLCERDKQTSQSIAVIDEGNGSTEIVFGEWSDQKITNFKAETIETGAQALMELYADSPDDYLSKLVKIIQTVKADTNDVMPKHMDIKVYIAGGVATKIGWMSVRKGLDDHYNPARVNGVKLSVMNFIDIFKTVGKMYETNPIKAQRFVDQRRGSESETPRVISSAPYLAFLRNIFNNGTDIFITGYGVRHGIGFLMLNDLI